MGDEYEDEAEAILNATGIKEPSQKAIKEIAELMQNTANKIRDGAWDEAVAHAETYSAENKEDLEGLKDDEV